MKRVGLMMLISAIICFLPMVAGAILYFINPNDYGNKITVLFLQLTTCGLFMFLLIVYWLHSKKHLKVIVLIKLTLVLPIIALFLSLLFDYYGQLNNVPIAVEESALTQFNISSVNATSTVFYNLTVVFKIGPNRKTSAVLFDHVQIWAAYQGQIFAAISIPRFFLAGKNNHSYNASTVFLSHGFRGQSGIVLPDSQVGIYELDAAARRFNINVTCEIKGSRVKREDSILKDGDKVGRVVDGTKTFELMEIPLPNATSEWEKGGLASYETKVVIYSCGVAIFGVIVFIVRLCVVNYPNGESLEDKCCLLFSVLGFILFVVLLVLQLTNRVKVDFRISDVAMSEFELSSSSGTLKYNMSMVVSIGPNNEETGVYFDRLGLRLIYFGQQFVNETLPSSYLQEGNSDGGRTLVFRPRFAGNGEVVLKGKDMDKYLKEHEKRKYSIFAMLSYEGWRTNDHNLTQKNDYGGRLVNGVAKFKLNVPLLI